MYCLTIEESNCDTRQLYFNDKENADEWMEKLILDEICKYLYIKNIHTELRNIDIDVLGNLLTALVTKECKYDNFDVTLSKIHIEDE